MSNVQITKRHNNVTVDKSSPAHLLLGEEVKASIHPPPPLGKHKLVKMR